MGNVINDLLKFTAEQQLQGGCKTRVKDNFFGVETEKMVPLKSFRGDVYHWL